jgi:hypothetical protein
VAPNRVVGPLNLVSKQHKQKFKKKFKILQTREMKNKNKIQKFHDKIIPY